MGRYRRQREKFLEFVNGSRIDILGTGGDKIVGCNPIELVDGSAAAQPISEEIISNVQGRDDTPSTLICDSAQWLRRAIAHDIAVNKQREGNAVAKKPDIWRSDTDGKMYHGFCFETSETKDGFTQVKSLDDLEEDAACDSCEGVFLVGVTSSGMTDDDEDDDEDC